jgi:hypothetical protein
LRGDEGNIDGHKKKDVLENCWSKKKDSCSQYDSFMGIGEVLGTAEDALTSQLSCN